MADVKIDRVEVQKTVTVTEKRFVITLNEEEARCLVAVVGKLGGGYSITNVYSELMNELYGPCSNSSNHHYKVEDSSYNELRHINLKKVK